MPGTIMDPLFPGASDSYGCGLAIGWGMVGGGALGGAAAAVPGVVIGAAVGGITAGCAAPACSPPTPTPAMAADTMDSSGFASDPGQADMSNASFGSWGGGPTSYSGDGGGADDWLCC
jgi:hypothetical protein